MRAICLYFKVHQPFQLKHFSSTDIDMDHNYEDAEADRESINKLADNCYLPSNNIILSLIKNNGKKFKVSYSISGTVLELFQRYRPDVTASFRELVSTGCVEILAETYYHSLSYLHSKREFIRQVTRHSKLVKKLFAVEPAVFRNTELIYNNDLAGCIGGLGIKGILCEGVERILQGRSANQLYSTGNQDKIKLLLRNIELSDDIAFRFDDPNWSEHPLMADKFAAWIHSHPADTDVINLFMDYETFGIHKKKESGIFEFLKALPSEVFAKDNWIFSMPSEVLNTCESKDIYDVPQTISWDDKSAGCYAWFENVMQNNTLKKIYSIEKMVLQNGSDAHIELWGRFQAADYIYYMARERSVGDTYKYHNPFPTAEEAFQNYTNMVIDFEIALIKKGIGKSHKKSLLKSFSTGIF